MKTCEVLDSAAIELYFYDELDSGERISVEQHLRTCSDCRGALDELRLIRTVLASRPDVDAPPEGNWGPFMARLEAAVEREPKLSAVVVPFAEKPASKAARSTSSNTFAAYAAIAATLMLVTSGSVYLSRVRHAAPPAVTTAANPIQPAVESPAEPAIDSSRGAAAPAARTDAAFASVSEQHFERSKLVVLGLATKDPREVSEQDWAYERQLASSLLDDTRLYRITAQERGMKTLADVMSDLELVLLQASLADEHDSATLERIQRLIRKRDLMTKINAATAAGI
jgi:Putative zinc-finger